MRLSELLQRLDDGLHDPSALNWPEAQRVRWADQAIATLHQWLIEADKGYADFELFVPKTSFSGSMSSVLDYRPPQWVANVVDMHTLTATPDAENPSVNTVALDRGTSIGKSSAQNSQGWTFTQRNVLRLVQFGSGVDVVVRVAKRPARLLRVTLDSAAPSTTVVDFPQSIGSADVGQVHTEDDWYRGEQFYALSTNQSQASHPIVGVSRRCIRSQANVVVGGALHTRLTFDQAWPTTLVSGDVLELEVVIPDEHSELVVLEVMRQAFLRKESVDGLAAIGGSLAIARDAYRRFIQPRGVREPEFYRTGAEGQATEWSNTDPALWDYL